MAGAVRQKSPRLCALPLALASRLQEHCYNALGRRMPGPVDTFLKVSLAASLLAAGGSVGYYYAAYLPAQDAQLDSERVHAESARKAAEDGVQAEREATEQRNAQIKL